MTKTAQMSWFTIYKIDLTNC